jgi:fatty acid desaturase
MRDMAQAAGSVHLAGEGEPSRNPYREHRGLLSPQEVRELSRLRSAPPLRDTAIAWGKILAAWVAVGFWPEWWVVLLAIPVIGTANYALHILGHDAMHRRYLPDPRWNDLLADLFLYGPVAAVTHVIGRNHLLHHLHLASGDDPDRHKYATSHKRTKLDLVLYLSGVSNLLPVIRGVFLRRASDVSDAAQAPEFAASRDGNGIGYTRRDLAITLGWQVLLVAGLSWGIGWWAYPVLWLVPVYVFRYCADEARQFLEHAHPEPDEIADAHRLITYTSNPIERLFFSPLNMNLHTAHHLWPSIPYYNLPAADRLIGERNRSPDLVWRGSYLGSLRRYFRSLPLAATS